MRKISRFEINETVGAGAMSTVHRAVDSASGEVVAVKLLHPHHISSDMEMRFQREAEALLALKHPNIVQIREFGQSPEGQQYSVWDFVDGKTLSAFLERERKIQPDLAAMMVLELARGVAAAHELGIIHRDLKPANIMINREGQLKISDFGLMHFKDNAEFTKPGTRVGSPAFMSPEQIRGVRPTPAMDIFSLGVMFYLFLTGELPFKGQNRQETFELIQHKIPEAPSRLIRHVPQTLSNLCMSMLGKMHEKRLVESSELIDHLERYLDHVELNDYDRILHQYLLHPRDQWEYLRRELLNAYLRAGQKALQAKKQEDSLEMFQMVLHLTGVTDQPSHFPDDVLPTKKVSVRSRRLKNQWIWLTLALIACVGIALVWIARLLR